MGCDIHAIVQVKSFRSKEWITVNTDAINIRSYTMFGFLAGVRNHTVTPISEPKGLPDDIKLQRKDKYPIFYDGWEYEEGTGACLGEFGHSYLTLAEIENYRLNDGDVQDWVESGMEHLLGYLQGIKYLQFCDDIRIVFGFDT